MQLQSEQIERYQRDGYLLMPDVFSKSAVECMKAEIVTLCAEASPSRFLERDGETVRSIYGAHLSSDLFQSLTVNPRILEPARALLHGDVYCYQTKINSKRAFSGDSWAWHQDLIYWRNQDGVPNDKMINIAVFLNDCTEFNGPILAIPGSHSRGELSAVRPTAQDSTWRPEDPKWRTLHAARLKEYLLDRATIQREVAKRGMTSMKGPSGSIVIFHPNLVHGSTSNISPDDRAMIIVTYNSTENLPIVRDRPRPDFFASRDHRPLVARVDVRLDN